jgi:hypothetical protein
LSSASTAFESLARRPGDRGALVARFGRDEAACAGLRVAAFGLAEARLRPLAREPVRVAFFAITFLLLNRIAGF